MKISKILLSEEQIQAKVKEVGQQIAKDYAGKNPVLICMLKGAYPFFWDLSKNIDIDLSVDFARVSSYKNGTESGKLDLMLDVSADISGKDVILVEDVVDSGNTLSYFTEYLKGKKPASIKICAFLDKPERRVTDVKVDYVCFSDLKCGFVVGYGMDFAEKYRNIPYLAEMEED